MKKLGVIGGLGPMATVYFMQLLTEMMDAKTDQEHMEILLHSKPEIPDRTEFILGNSEKNPVPQLIEIGNELKKSGAEVLAVPCITAHCFHRMLENSVGMPVINAIEETSLHLKENGIQKVEKGIFGAEMKVLVSNDGPISIVLDTDKIMAKK